MSTIAKPPRPMRMNQKAELVPEARFAAWHQCAAATPGLTKLELAILDGLCEHHRRLHIDGYAGRLSIERMALDLDAVPRDVRVAVRHLVELCLVAVRPERIPARAAEAACCITVDRGGRAGTGAAVLKGDHHHDRRRQRIHQHLVVRHARSHGAQQRSTSRGDVAGK